MFLKGQKLIHRIFDALIVFVCLIGAAEIKGYACISDDEFDYAIQTFNSTQEMNGQELEKTYERQKLTSKDQSTQTERVIIVTTHPPLHAQWKSFFEAIQNIPDRGFLILYCSVATIFAADGLLSMRMAGYLTDSSLLHMGAFEFISGASLLAIPFLAFQLRKYR